MQRMNKDAEGGKAWGWMGKGEDGLGRHRGVGCLRLKWAGKGRGSMYQAMEGVCVIGGGCLRLRWVGTVSILGGVLQPGALQKNRCQLKKGGGVSSVPAVCLT